MARSVMRRVMSNLIAAAAAFVLIHLLISGTRVRDALTGAIGEGPYMGLFSVASVACLVWLGVAFLTSILVTST